MSLVQKHLYPYITTVGEIARRHFIRRAPPGSPPRLVTPVGDRTAVSRRPHHHHCHFSSHPPPPSPLPPPQPPPLLTCVWTMLPSPLPAISGLITITGHTLLERPFEGIARGRSSRLGLHPRTFCRRCCARGTYARAGHLQGLHTPPTAWPIMLMRARPTMSAIVQNCDTWINRGIKC